MSEREHTIVYKLRFPVFGALVFVGLLLLSLLLSAVGNSVQARDISSTTQDNTVSSYDSPNVVTDAMANTSIWFQNSLASTEVNANNNIRSLGAAATQSRKFVTNKMYVGAVTTTRFVGSGLKFVAVVNINALKLMIRVPSHIIGMASNSRLVTTVIRPSEHASVPIIDPNSPELIAALTALPPTKATSQPTPLNSVNPIWPIRGKVTTEFGVAHWPYQPTHTGLDISDGQRSGVTPVKPFRPGRVILAGHSNNGLGIQVVIDHGSGVTSVYGHMSSVAVSVGQQVDQGVTLGYEGSTGVSTGTHLHFEIRVNGQATDPHNFVSGQPY